MKAFYLLLLLPFPALAACPKSKKEWQAQGPKLLLAKAARQPAPVELPDFSAKLGQKGFKASAIPFRERKRELVMVQAQDDAQKLFLSGVLRCDEQKHEPVLVSLSYVKGEKSGLVKVANP